MSRYALTFLLYFVVVVFEPNLHDPLVETNGVLPYQVYLNTKDIYDVSIERDNEKYFMDTTLELSYFTDDNMSLDLDFIIDEKQYAIKKKLIFKMKL